MEFLGTCRKSARIASKRVETSSHCSSDIQSGLLDVVDFPILIVIKGNKKNLLNLIKVLACESPKFNDPFNSIS